MSGLFMGGIIALAVIIMIIAISKFKQHPFVVMVLVSIFVGLSCGMPADKVISTVKSGFGGILSSIGIVIVAGTIIGTILEKTGAALVMANTILGIVGKTRSALTMGLTGFVTGIPVFCDSGFVILSPIARALADRSNTSLAVMGTALSAGLYATHCLVPPTPGPIAMAGTLNADLGVVIVVGLVTSIPAMAAGILYAKKVACRYDIPANPEFTVEELMEKYGRLPGVVHSFAPIILPIILIAFKSVADFPAHPLGTGAVKTFASFIGDPVIALLIGIFLAMTLIPVSESDNKFDWMCQGILNSASILVITGAGGSFGAILKTLPLAEALSSALLSLSIGVFLPFIISALLKTAMGASTVAMIVTSAMVAPLMPSLGFESEIGKALVIMAIGAGSMCVSHANDSYFWVVTQFSDMSTNIAYKCQTGVTFVEGITTVVFVYILSLIFC